ncbi:MAG: hypothetical protein ACYC7F_06690 [Gemmatimonadaceae bacterium]
MPSAHLQQVAQLRLDSERRLAIVVTSLMLLPNVLFAFADHTLVSEPATLRLLYALRASQVALWIGSVVLIGRARSRATLDTLLFALAMGVVVFVLLVAWLRPADNWMPVRTLIILSFGTFVALPYRFRYQFVSWGVLAVGTVMLLWWRYTAMTGVDRFSALSNFALAGALGAVVARSRARLDRDLDASLARESAAIAEHERAAADLRRLEGIIPICTYCHQVHTEAGAWEQLDQYVRARTDADFSHGMCPSCARLHFPEIMEPTSDPLGSADRRR